MDKLEEKGWIESETVNSEKGRKDSTSYSIVFSIQNLIHVLKKYPDLISKMQKNDSIVEKIFREHLNLIYGSKDMEFLNNRFWECSNKNWSITSTRTPPLGSHPNYDSSKRDGAQHTEATLFEKIEKSFKEKLQLSPEFFRLFLNTDINKLRNSIKKLIGSLENRVCMTDRKYNQDPNNWTVIHGITCDIDKIFKLCVYRDIFKKQCHENSIEYLKQTKNEISKDEKMIEFVKYLKAERKFSDEQTQKLRKELKKLLNQAKKEISNAEIQKLKESIDEIWFLRDALIEYIIETKNEISDAEIQKLRDSDKKYDTLGFFKESIRD